MPVIGMIMCLFLYFLAKISLKSKVDLNSSNVESTIKNKKKTKRLISLFLFVSEIEVIILYSIMQLSIIYSFYSDKLLLYLNIFVAISMVIFVLGFINIGINERSVKEDDEEVYKDDDKNWILGSFYYNKNDPAFIIEKRSGIGYTVNFANKIAFILLVVLILFSILMSLI